MKNIIIKDFDQFKKVNESDMTLFSFLAGQAGDQIAKAAKERATAMIFEYFGVPPIDPNNPESKSQWITELFYKVIGEVSLKDMDNFLLGRKSLNDEEYWIPILSKALKRQIVQIGPRPSDVIDLIGVTPSGFLGRLITNMYTEFILDEKRLQQLIISVWRLVAKEEFIPQKDANEIYRDAYKELTPEQQEKVGGSIWQSAMKNQDYIRTKGD